ncbi:MAG: DUF1294 domain-containing protein [Saccharofermentans sp.]|nr:DUF1294 domain-containing protein [Saccharofermentans sp.]
MILVYYLILVNLVAFLLYGVDKAYAKTGARRIPEKTLLFWAWIGGSIGAFLGMNIFHHKTLKAKFFVVPVLAVLEIIICCFCLYQNYHLTVSEYDVDLGLGRDFTIVQVSDLHNQIFGIGESALLKKIEAADPDFIVVTGDLIDKTHTSYSIAQTFMVKAADIAPVYYVTGNHEAWLNGEKFEAFKTELSHHMGIHFLDDKYYESDEYIIAGIADASLDSFAAYPAFTDEKPVIMLAHEPQYTGLYQSLGADLVLTGHYHGGQIIIPGVGGLVSPEFEFLPDYYEGMRTFGDMTMILSRGLGNSLAPVRINDYPELVVVKVH